MPPPQINNILKQQQQQLKVHAAVLEDKPKENVEIYQASALHVTTFRFSQRSSKSICSLEQYKLITEFWR